MDGKMWGWGMRGELGVQVPRHRYRWLDRL